MKTKDLSKNMNQWQQFVAEIRSWDRKEHNWAINGGTMPHKNLTTKNDFIHSLMKKYKLSKKVR